MPVLFLKNNCVACKMTKKHLEAAGVLQYFEIRNIETENDPAIDERIDELKAEFGFKSAPILDTADIGIEPFAGFVPKKIRLVASVLNAR
ncbi:MAG: glutaredoxin domain-containing protein [bacterium]|nr:glutaredoxin domain-containing protein [bacterium]